MLHGPQEPPATPGCSISSSEQYCIVQRFFILLQSFWGSCRKERLKAQAKNGFSQALVRLCKPFKVSFLVFLHPFIEVCPQGVTEHLGLLLLSVVSASLVRFCFVMLVSLFPSPRLSTMALWSSRCPWSSPPRFCCLHVRILFGDPVTPVGHL